MDWISITTNCYATSNAIAKTSNLLHTLLREIRELRTEIDQILGELHSLDTTLDLLKEDAASLPSELARQTPIILVNCATIVNEIGAYTTLLSSRTLSTREKKLRWTASRRQMGTLRAALQGHIAVLGLAVDLAGLTAIRKPVHHDGFSRPASDQVAEILLFSAEIRWLPPAMEEDVRAHPVNRAYLDVLEAHAEASGITVVKTDPADLYRTSSEYSGDPPDSAIDLVDSPINPTATTSFSRYANPPIDEVDESFGELAEMTSPPVPPPRSPERANSTQRYGNFTRPIPRPRTAAADAPSLQNRRSSPVLGTDIHLLVPQRTSSVRLADSALPASRDGDWDADSAVASLDFSSKPTTPNRTGLGGFFRHVRNKVSTSALPSRQTSVRERPSTAIETAGASERASDQSSDRASDRASDRLSIRRSTSKRISTTLKLFPLSRKVPEPPASSEPDAVFGVSLTKSMQIVSAGATTRHGGDGGGTSSRRFPLCVLKCASYVREKGLNTVDIFSPLPDDDPAVALQMEFSTGPRYGEDLDLDFFGPSAAAELILRYLSQLQRPLVPERVARRWVKLSKQATVAGMAAMRFDECIDFWEEAFGGMRGPSRNVLKLLLNLWGDVADHAYHNEMTAERLAGSLVKPLLHTPPGTFDTDLMLGLAFVIRKRSEYSILLQGNPRPSNAAFLT